MNHLNFSIKNVGDADSGIVEGFAATYNGGADRVGDIIAPGAFAKTLAESGGRVPLLAFHKQEEPIGRCILQDSPTGLKVTAKLVLAVPEAQKVWSLLKAGVLSAFSIGYEVRKSSRRGDVRVLEEIQLWEVSVVTTPANPLATVTALKNTAEGNELEQFPAMLSTLAMSVRLAATAREMTARLK